MILMGSVSCSVGEVSMLELVPMLCQMLMSYGLLTHLYCAGIDRRWRGGGS